MADRRALNEELNKINKLYQEYDLQMSKAGASNEERQRLRDMMNAKKDRLTLEMGDHLQNMNAGRAVLVPGGTVSKAAKEASEGIDVADIRKKGIIKGVGKKMLGALPLVGGIAQALDSGNASAAIPLLDEAEDVGMSAADENIMLAEDDAKKDYAKSPARMNKLKKLLGK